MYNIVIVGAGGLGREVYRLVRDCFDLGKYQIKGFLAQNPNELDNFNTKHPIIGHENNYNIDKNDRFIIAIGDVSIKKRVANALKAKGAKFINLIHPTAIIFPSATIGNGVVIFPYSVVSDNVVIGDFVKLNMYVYCGHDSKVGDYCTLSPYSTLNGSATLENEVFLATRVTVTASKKVGKRSILGAHSLALHNIPQNTKLLGVSKTQL